MSGSQRPEQDLKAEVNCKHFLGAGEDTKGAFMPVTHIETAAGRRLQPILDVVLMTLSGTRSFVTLENLILIHDISFCIIVAVFLPENLHYCFEIGTKV